MKITKAAALALCTFAAPQLANAQTMQFTDKGYVGASFAGQVGSHDITTSSTFDLYGEQANTQASQTVKSGALFDIGGAYRVWHNNLLAGMSYSHEASTGDVSITASIPDLLVFGRLRNVSSSVSGAKHSEDALHFDAIWMMPVANKLDVAIFGGPSIIWVRQDTVGPLTVTEPAPTVTGQIVREKGTAGGINLGVDVQYLVWQKVAVGGLIRYTWGDATLAGADKKLTVGGFQIGAGARYRF